MRSERPTVFLLCWMLLVSLDSGTAAAEPQGGIRLYILSGQSNMAGLDPARTFTPAVREAHEGEAVVVVKDAQGGQPIRRWHKAWKSPADRQVPVNNPGDLYDRLMAKVRDAVGDKPVRSVCFVWMQGERDAREQLSGVYADSLRGLIGQVRADMKTEKVVFVIGRLSDNQNHEHWNAVRRIQQEVAEADPHGTWVDTDDLNGPKNGLHYTPEGYDELGRRFAAACLAELRQ